MTPEQVKQLEQLLIRSCDAHIADGGRVIAGVFRGRPQYSPLDGSPIPSMDCCPMTCAGVDGFGYLDVLAKKLGFNVSYDEAQEFVWNFDHSAKAVYSFFDPHRWGRIARMARRLRKRYLTNKGST